MEGTWKIDNEKRIARLKEEDYQELFGVNKATFEKMLEILEARFKNDHAMGGKPPRLNVLDRLVIMLCYYRECRTTQHIAFDYGVAKSAVCGVIHWAENTLIKSGEFRLPSKK